MNNRSAQLNKTADDQYQIIGTLTYASVPALYNKSLFLFDTEEGELVLDFQKTTQVDSAGFALVVEWQRLARQKNKILLCHHIPQQMKAIAELSGLSMLLDN
ncbi:MAG TPA: STAS domain-containing protein [Gammaproteobacteria bacterium]|nr:STAS domain-containing protein [Gammaproteobacteria bacterium]